MINLWFVVYDNVVHIFQNDEVTLGLRGLMKLSKLLKVKRTANGALTLASSEVVVYFFILNIQLDSFRNGLGK